MVRNSSTASEILAVRPSRRGFLIGGGAVGLAGLLAACGLGGGGEQGAAGSGKGDIRALFMKQAGYWEENINEMVSAFQKATPEIKVSADFVAYEALHDKIVAAAPAGTYDVVLIDVIWPAEFASKNVIAGRDRPLARDARSSRSSTARWTTAEYDGKFYGVPWILDTKYLFYNTKTCRRPAWTRPLDTWDGVVDAARALKSTGVVEYPLVWSWAAGRGAHLRLRQLLGAFGGSFFDDSGKPAFKQERRCAGARVHAADDRRRAHQPGLDPVSRGGRPQGLLPGEAASP